jgi:hypothetical protein
MSEIACSRQLSCSIASFAHKVLTMRSALIGVALVLLLPRFCLAQSVTVRVVNDKNGRPLPSQAVSVQFFYEKPARVTQPFRATTDSKGEAQFSIPQPNPEHLDVRVALTSEHWICRCWLMSDIEPVLRKGVALTPQSKPPWANAEPGLIVFHARPFTLAERLLYPIMKQ